MGIKPLFALDKSSRSAVAKGDVYDLRRCVDAQWEPIAHPVGDDQAALALAIEAPTSA